MRREATHLLLMDDSPERQPCECDVVLNPDPDATDARYPDREGPTQFLLGPRYALLRKEFLNARIHSEVAATARRVLITMGGGDEHNVTLQASEALQGIRDTELDVTVVVGASYQHRESLQAAIERSPQPTKLLSNVQNMPELMAQADLAITAGGGTCYELAFMGVPMFLITTAKNHERAVATFASAGAALDAGWYHSLDRTTLASSLRRVIRDRELRQKMTEAASCMVDGKGAQRVVETMHAILQHNKHVPA
jgi:spore coat polysaccharide biosynthesis predicted glycosyltransferase SpsG